MTPAGNPPVSALQPTPSDAPSLMGRLGLSAPAAPDVPAAMEVLKPLLDGQTGVVRISPADMDTPGLVESLAKVEAYLPVLGLSTMPTPDGGGIIFDPAKYNPSQSFSARPQAAPQPQAAPAQPASARNVVGSASVNAERAKASQPPPPESNTSPLMGSLMSRAF